MVYGYPCEKKKEDLDLPNKLFFGRGYLPSMIALLFFTLKKRNEMERKTRKSRIHFHKGYDFDLASKQANFLINLYRCLYLLMERGCQKSVK